MKVVILSAGNSSRMMDLTAAAIRMAIRGSGISTFFQVVIYNFFNLYLRYLWDRHIKNITNQILFFATNNLDLDYTKFIDFGQSNLNCHPGAP